MAGRTVSVVLVDQAGQALGQLPDLDVEVPYWQEVADVVAGVRDRHGIGVDVLRLLAAERSEPHGGHVTYLAELVEPRAGGRRPPLGPVRPEVAAAAGSEDPLRMVYARPGGPAETVRWALERIGPAAAATQQRTWNLSAIWRVHGPDGLAWLKQVPPFFAHEGAVLAWLGANAPGAAPTLLDHHAGSHRLLMAEVPGHDLPAAGLEVRRQILRLVVHVQQVSVSEVEGLQARGVPDRRGQKLVDWAQGALQPYVSGAFAAMMESLPRRMSDLDACGFPDVLVHGDLWPGNAVGEGEQLALLDWGDSFLGHPGFDALRLVEGLAPATADILLEDWAEAWKRAVPGCEPRRALDLLRPLAPLRMAAVYADFLAAIEATERIYHAADVPSCLGRALAAGAGDDPLGG